ncbi:condensation domain-containing protein [Nocardia sp. CDC159]|uniref:Condensation domain-containing protein n=1 Tax=Nocardia pulmonis TaxID=2951408 RepID=A0A9X2IX34_9NOCA|nr:MULTISPECIES: condensation domain-containing protein [Nocardia]MCM6772496.1 condensation domain-containing protein [Nocardia pulmonis]MCM6784846.1 condensation domain-containing protein [Nocardia sp. CDC159]
MPSNELRPTAAQEEFWHYQQDGPDPVTAMFNVAEYAEFHGPVSETVLARAIRWAVGEIEVCNLGFAQTPAGVRLRPRTPRWEVRTVDLSGHDDPLAAAAAWMAADLDTPVDLVADELFTHAILRLGSERVWWYHRVHHILLDGYGLAQVARRVAQVYTALLAGREPAPSRFGSLAEVVAHEESERDGPGYAAARDYWLRYHRDRPAPPIVAPRTEPMTGRMARTATEFDPDLLARLRERGGSATALLAAAATYVHRVTGQSQIRLCLPVLARAGTPAARVPCTVINVVYYWAEFDSRTTFSDAVEHIEGFLRDSAPHLRYRVVDLWRDLGPAFDHDRAYGPLANVMPFDFAPHFADTPATIHNVTAGVEEDIGFYFYDRPDAMEFVVGGNPHLFGVEDLTTHATAFQRLLTAALATPDRPVNGLASG